MKWNIPVGCIGLSLFLMQCSSPSFNVSYTEKDSGIDDTSCESAAALCNRWGKNCGSFTSKDICEIERTVNCGSCGEGSCGGGGKANICGTILSYDIPKKTITSVWSLSSTSAFLVSKEGSFGQWDGSTWSYARDINNTILYDIWGIDAQHIWIVGAKGLILAWNGTKLSTENGSMSEDYNLYSIRGTGLTDLWAVGGKGTNGAILHRTQSNNWNYFPRENHPLLSVTSVSATKAYAVGEAGELHVWDGNNWSTSQLQGRPNLRSVWGISTNDVWMVGGNGSVFRWNGKEWTLLSIPDINMTLNKVWGTGPDDVWVVGEKGTILHWDGLQWRQTVLTGHENTNFLGVSGTTNAKDPVWIYGEGILWQMKFSQ